MKPWRKHQLPILPTLYSTFIYKVIRFGPDGYALSTEVKFLKNKVFFSHRIRVYLI